jgi:flagellar biosynthetic protein FliQ
VNSDTATGLAIEALTTALKISMPFLLAGLVVGLAVSVFQAVTQIQEMTLSFIPKIIVVGVVMILGGPWMLDQMVSYTQELYQSIPAHTGK